MTPNEEIKGLMERIRQQENRRSMALGVIEQLRTRWKDEFGTDDPVRIEAELARLVEEAKVIEQSIEDNLAIIRKALAQAEAIS